MIKIALSRSALAFSLALAGAAVGCGADPATGSSGSSGGGEGGGASTSTATGAGGGASGTCSDGLLNGGETGVDCGGPQCTPCMVPRLSVSGPQILDPNGTPILLRGWNWGEWGSVQPQDGADNAAQHANVVRIPLRWWGEYSDPSIDSRSDKDPGHIEPKHLEALDAMIKQATDQHLWVDLFLDSDCGQASVVNDTASYCGTTADQSPANFNNDPAMKQKFVEAWQFVVDRYKNTPYMGMYEILPEPNFTCTNKGCADMTTAPKFYASVIPILRAIDARTPILIGADGGYDLRKIETAYIPGVTGLIYTGDLLNNGSTHPEWLTAATDFRAAHSVPVFIQQIGVRKSDANAEMTTTTILDALAADGIGWTWWTYREPRAPGGMGFAPWSADKNGVWTVNTPWLSLISGKFQ